MELENQDLQNWTDCGNSGGATAYMVVKFVLGG